MEPSTDAFVYCVVCSGPAEHGALCRPVQPDQAAGPVPGVGGEDHGGVLPAGGQGATGRPRYIPHV